MTVSYSTNRVSHRSNVHKNHCRRQHLILNLKKMQFFKKAEFYFPKSSLAACCAGLSQLLQEARIKFLLVTNLTQNLTFC